MVNDIYTVIYRMGGRVRWTWRAMLDHGIREWADGQARLLLKQGYHSHVIRVSALRRHGLPETFSPEQSVESVRFTRWTEHEISGELLNP